MKIYTKTGDKGDTSLFGGVRVSKDEARIEAYGTVDELNSVLGVVRSGETNADINAILETIQLDLFALGADLATPRSVGKDVRRFTIEDARPLERIIDKLEESLPQLDRFILPGGSSAASMLHFARAVCRRAERAVVRLSRGEEVGEGTTIYLNRLSDLLFVLARHANRLSDTPEITWKA
jgi:cob(I)alamin adenosyltransferase